MNKRRRKEIKDVIEDLEKAKGLIESAKDTIVGAKENLDMIAMDEQDAFDSLPEGLQCSMRGEQMEENANDLDSACEDLDNIIDTLNNIIER